MAGRGEAISARSKARFQDLIKTREIIQTLQNHIIGTKKLTTTQVRAAEVLLRKVAPDLQATALTADAGAELPILKIIKRDAA